jgi:GMP synthase (glutamine-hydrolysing)
MHRSSQYTQLIARRIREAKVYCEIHPYNVGNDFIRSFNPRGIVLSGGPSSVHDRGAPRLEKEFFDFDFKVPVLGICYGMQLTAKLLGGKVERSKKREYGPATLNVLDSTDIFSGLGRAPLKVWMSHGDRVEKVPRGFKVTAHSANSVVGAMKKTDGLFYGVQFHPEVVHTPKGTRILRNFLYKVCKCRPLWTMRSLIETAVGHKRRGGLGRYSGSSKQGRGRPTYLYIRR